MSNVFDQFDEGSQGNVFDQFDAAAPEPQRTNTIGQEAARQAGLGVRALASAAASPVVLAGDAIGKGINTAAQMLESHPLYGQVFGQQRVQPYGRVLQRTLSRMGLPEPERPIERFTQAVADTAPAVALPAGIVPQVAGNAAINAALAPAGQEASGAAWGAAGGAVGHGLSKVVGALTPTFEAEKLVKAGVPLTYGQRLGPPVQSLENNLARVPYVGAPIRARQQEALAGWQQATRNEAVPGAKTIDAVGKELSTRYENLVGGAKFDHVPNVTVDALVERASKTPGATPSMLKTLGRELEDLKGQFTDAAPATFHKAESTLKQLAFRFKSSQNPEQQIYGEMLADAAAGLRDSWRSALPVDTRSALAQVDQAYAQFVPIRSASTKYVQTLDNPENYTPRMLQQTLRQKDTTPGKSQFRETPQGKLAHQGEETIGSRSNAPSTGTGISSLILGGGASVLGHTPAALTAAGLAAGYGTKAGQQLMIESLPLQRAIISALRRGSPAVAVQGARQNDQ